MTREAAVNEIRLVEVPSPVEQNPLDGKSDTINGIGALINRELKLPATKEVRITIEI